MTKSEAAFRMSVGKLFDEHRKVYFWTFTFTDVWDDWIYSRMFNRFWRKFEDSTEFRIAGIKVVELHDEHGIHYHCLLTQRLPVGMIRRIGAKYGIGRVHVKVCDRGAGLYLAKYLSKDGGVSSYIRKWSCIGSWQGVKKADVEYDSEFTRELKSITGSRQITYPGLMLAQQEYTRLGSISPQTILDNLSKGRQSADGKARDSVKRWMERMQQADETKKLRRVTSPCVQMDLC